MRKITSATPIVVMAGILAVFFVYMCLPQAQSDVYAEYTVDLNFFHTRGLYCVGIGIISMAAFYHLSLYIFRTSEKLNLIFSIWCIQLVVHFVFSQEGFNGVFQWIPNGATYIWLDNLSLFLRTYTLCTFTLYFFARSFLASYKTIWIAHLVFGIAFLLFVPEDSLLLMQVFFLANIVIPFLSIVIAFRYRKWRENIWNIIVFVALPAHLVFYVVFFFIFADELFMPRLFANLILILSQSLVLSKEYTNAFRLVEKTNTNLEQIVDDRTKDLQNTNNAMKELVGNISHDLKTPLAVMSINLEELSNLSQTQSDENYTKCVRVAYQKNLDLRRLIQNLMEVSRIETAQGLLRLEWIPLSELLSQAQDKYDNYLKDKGVFLEISYTSNAEIHADPQRIWSVFDNIVYNAARYTGEDGTISIHAAVFEKIVIITITDTGGGIAPEHLPHIFERFYKADPSRGTGGDSGLGLYIVRSIMEASGGSVTAASEPGKGTSIILRFVKK